MSLSAAVTIRKLITLTLPPLPISDRLARLGRVVALIGLGLVIAWLPPLPAALLLGGAIFFTLLLINPLLGLYLLIPIIPFSPLLAVTIRGVRVGLMEIVLAGTIIAWLLKSGSSVQHVQSPGGSKSSGDSPAQSWPQAGRLVWPFLLFLGGIGLSWLQTFSLGASLVETLKWVEMLVLYLFVVMALPARHLKWVVLSLLLAGLAQAVLGLYQFIFKVGPPGFLLFGGSFLRAYGTFAQPNPYAGYLGLVLPLALALVIWRLTEDRIPAFDFKAPASSKIDHLKSKIGNLKSKIVSLVLFGLPLGLLLAALLASQSRSAWLGFAIAALVTFTAYNRRTAMIVAAAGLIGAAVILVGAFDFKVIKFNTTETAMTQRLVEALSIFTITDAASVEIDDANFATIERLAHWQAARQMWRDHPWLGVGFGNYAVVYPAYAVGRWLDPLGHAHNYLLNIGAEAGLVGLVAYLIFWIFTFSVLWLAVRRSHGFDRAVAAGALGVMVHLHVHNLFDNLYVQGMYLHLAIILGLGSIIYGRSLLTDQ